MDTRGSKHCKQHGVTFCCSLANHLKCDVDKKEQGPLLPKLVFQCREPSYGVLTSSEAAVVEDDTETQQIMNGNKHPATCSIPQNDDSHKNGIEGEDEQDDDIYDEYDPTFLFLYDEGYPYALVGKTGFQVWPGTRILVDALTFPRPTDSPVLKYWQQRVNLNNITETDSNENHHKEPLRVLELGAGVGVVGCSLAAAGAQVLMTDLSGVVSDSLLPNLKRNANTLANNLSTTACNTSPEWLSSVATLDNNNNDDDGSHNNNNDHSSSSTIMTPIRFGRGWAAATSLDWTQPMEDQISPEQCRQIDLIVAGDCVWLPSMLQGLFSAVSAIFHLAKEKNGSKKSPPPRLLLSFQERQEGMFTNMGRFMEEAEAHQWTVTCLAWYPVTIHVDDDDLGGQEANDEGIARENCNGEHSNEPATISKQQKSVCLFELSPAE